MKISFIIITYKREKELKETLSNILLASYDDYEIVLIDNNEDYAAKRTVEAANNNKIKYFANGINYGVASGRNLAISKAQGNIVIGLDDDICIENIDELIDKTLKYFENDNKLGALAFNIVNFDLKKKLSFESPHCDKNKDFTKNFETYYFIGAGFAVKRKLFLELNLFSEDLGKYGAEELDFCFRLINSSKKILYCADIVVEHKRSPTGRMENTDVVFHYFVNRVKIAIKYLKRRYIISSYICWGYFFLYKTQNIPRFIQASRLLIAYLLKNRSKKSLFSVNFYKTINTLGGRIAY